MNNGKEWQMRLRELSLLSVLLAFLTSCSSFSLTDHPATLSVKKQRRAKDITLVVKAFKYEPIDQDEQEMAPADIVKWQELLAQGLDQSNIVTEVVPEKGDRASDNAAYSVDGKITRYYFKKNWIPTFFPVHLAASVFTLSLYTWLAGPTTVTKVDFEVQADLKEVKTGTLIKSFTERYQDTSPVNIYTKDTNNPYGNPSLVFSKVIDSLAINMAAALP
jgi:hypothetical protein